MFFENLTFKHAIDPFPIPQRKYLILFKWFIIHFLKTCGLILNIPAYVGRPEEYHEKPASTAGLQVEIWTWNLIYTKYECYPLNDSYESTCIKHNHITNVSK
jgi:hypothetical protein